ncbi:phiSA1p31-related protein [Streptomyces sp. MH60]|uniref:phiSA1p31-related protein n=1 Tax=Streptomyces sp. MH60 TaxID=1940758 RepID=UPI000CEE643A|nr:phiSA1p31-related protein [Streptomyces sp. MH60]PPS86452.1 hypothetical protein BZZ08_03419 [Streptomyces sp. MH60]
MAFKVGDKVEHGTFGKGEIAFGPYLSAFGVEQYLMLVEDGRHYVLRADADFKPAAKFEVGDKATGAYSRRVYTIVGGPFKGTTGRTWYATENRDGTVDQNSEGNLLAVTPEPAKDEALKVGDVVRILEDKAFGADVKAGDLFVVKRFCGNYPDRIWVDADSGAWTDEWVFRPQDFEKVAADEAAVVADKIYDLTARYRDTDGDYWTFKDVDGTVRGYCAGSNRDMSRMIDSESDTLESAAREYGPLVRV